MVAEQIFVEEKDFNEVREIQKHIQFIYGLVREGGRAKEYEAAIMWLCDCGLVHKLSRVNGAGIPLKAYREKFNPVISVLTSMSDYCINIS